MEQECRPCRKSKLRVLSKVALHVHYSLLFQQDSLDFLPHFSSKWKISRYYTTKKEKYTEALEVKNYRLLI